jgi:hypothetical protein
MRRKDLDEPTSTWVSVVLSSQILFATASKYACMTWNVTHKGKAPEVVPGLSDGSDGSPMSAKVRVQRSNHRLIGPVGGWRSDDHDLLARGAVGGGPFTTGLHPFGIGGGNNGSTGHYMLGVNNGGNGSRREGLGHLDKPCLGSSSTLPFLGRRGLGEGNSGGCRHCE